MQDDFLESSGREGGHTDLGETLRSLFHRVRLLLQSYWWILLLCLSIGLLIQGFRVRSMRDAWESSAQLIIQGNIEIQEADRLREVATNFHDNQLHLMTGQWVSERAAERVRALHPEIEKDWVSLWAGRKGTTDIFQLVASGGSARYTQAYLAQIIQAYLEFRRQTRLETSDDVMLSIGEELRELEVKIQQGQESIRRFQQENNTVAIKELSEKAAGRLSELKTRLEDYRTQLRILESFDEDVSLDQIQDVVNLDTIESSQNYRNTKRQYQQLLAMKEQFGIYLKPKHPKMMDIEAELEILGNRIKIFREQAFGQIEEEKSALRNRIDTLMPEINKWEEEVVQYSLGVADLETMNSNLNRLLTTRESLVRRKERLDIGRNVDTELISVLVPATPAVLRQVDKRKEIATGGVMGLGMGAAIVFLLAALNNRITSADDLRRMFSAKVIGLIPQTKAKITVLRKDADDVFAESFRALRSSILLHRQDSKDPRQVFLVTSCAPAEGKSTVSSNLAVTLAYSGAKTLLIDCDLRRGHLHDKFGIDRDPGLAELLEHPEMDVQDVILVGDQELGNLSVISAGRPQENPGDLFLNERMDAILSACRQLYDFVILDTAPILAVDDTIGLLRRADDVVFVVKAGQTNFRQVKISLERLSVTKTKVWGFVMNYVKASGTDYYYYGRYKSYRYNDKSGAVDTGDGDSRKKTGRLSLKAK